MDLLKTSFWGLLRLAFAYLSLSFTLPLLVLTHDSQARFYEFHLQALAGVSLVIAVLGLLLYKKFRFREAGTLIFLALAGAIVLAMYDGESVRLGRHNVSIYSLFLASLLFIAYSYFIFPIRALKPLLMLLPISALAWFIVSAIYRPVNMTYEILLSRDRISEENYTKLLELLPDLYLSGLISGLFSIGVCFAYFIARHGHNPSRLYQKVVAPSRHTK